MQRYSAGLLKCHVTYQARQVVSYVLIPVVGGPLPWMERKRLLAEAGNRAGWEFGTEHVYTFHFWQHMLDCALLQLDMHVARFDLAAHLAGQPLQLMAKTRASNSYLWNLELWHEKLLKTA